MTDPETIPTPKILLHDWKVLYTFDYELPTKEREMLICRGIWRPQKLPKWLFHTLIIRNRLLSSIIDFPFFPVHFYSFKSMANCPSHFPSILSSRYMYKISSKSSSSSIWVVAIFYFSCLKRTSWIPFSLLADLIWGRPSKGIKTFCSTIGTRISMF